MTFTENYKRIFTDNSLGEFATDELSERFEALTARMLEVNTRFNLTAIKDEPGIILKHYADSLTVSRFIPEGSRVIDIGCGAGFPSLPLAIARPDLKITALDSTAKRIGYINETAELFGLSNLTAITSRAEDAAHAPELRESFDIVCARAVARMNVLAELCLGFVRVGGAFIAMKANVDDELAEAKSAVKLLGGGEISLERFELLAPDSSENPRAIVTVKKSAKTDRSYPRPYSQITKKPL